MKLKKYLITVFCICIIIILIVIIILFIPVKFAVNINTQNLDDDKYEEVYIVETSSSSSGYYVAKKQKNNIKEDLYFAIFNGENFEKELGLMLGLHSEFENDNKFVIYGKSFEYIPKAKNYGFNIEKWEIVYPIKREPSLYALFASDRYFTLFDYIYNKYLLSCKENFSKSVFEN